MMSWDLLEYERAEQGIVLLKSQCARARGDAASEIARVGLYEALAALKALLDDEAPLFFEHAGRRFACEVRSVALEAIQHVYRSKRMAIDFGPVLVRQAMPVDEIRSAAERSLAALSAWRRWRVRREAERWVRECVQPSAGDRAVAVGYRVLQRCGQISYRLEEVDPVTYRTPTQEDVLLSQRRSPRPRPHLRVAVQARPDDVLGFVYRSEPSCEWLLDFVKSFEANEAAERAGEGLLHLGILVEVEVGVEHVLALAPRGEPLSVPDLLDVLRSLQVHLSRDYAVDLVT